MLNHRTTSAFARNLVSHKDPAELQKLLNFVTLSLAVFIFLLQLFDATALRFKEISHDSGKVHLQEQKIMHVEELVKLCTRTEERYPGFKKYDFLQIVDGTQMFSEKRIVGSGGFGTVYKVNVNRNVNLLVY